MLADLGDAQTRSLSGCVDSYFLTLWKNAAKTAIIEAARAEYTRLP